MRRSTAAADEANAAHRMSTSAPCLQRSRWAAWPGPKGWAVGGVDANCHSRHSYVSATVYLWRWNSNSGWTQVGSGSGAYSNAYGISAWTTPPLCGGGNTYWDETATVRVDNSSKTFDLYQGLGRYPQYAPGNC
jgi:hypothetical protein